MATDKTWFDDWLKGNLFLDVGFRVLIWTAIVLVTFRHAAGQVGFSPIAIFENSFKGLLPVMVDVVRVSIILCLLALILKDLEHVAPEKWGQGTLIGRAGGVVRRLAGDLSLWTIGALVTLMASVGILVFYIYRSGSWSAEVSSFTITMALVMLVSIAIFSVVSVWARRDVALVSSHAKFLETFNTPWKVVLFYLAWIAFTWIVY